MRADCIELVNLGDKLSQGSLDNPIQSDSPPCWVTSLALQREFTRRRPKSSVPALPKKLFSRFRRDTLALMKWQAWIQNNRRQSCKWLAWALYGKGLAPLKVKDFLRKHKKSQVFVKLIKIGSGKLRLVLLDLISNHLLICICSKQCLIYIV